MSAYFCRALYDLPFPIQCPNDSYEPDCRQVVQLSRSLELRSGGCRVARYACQVAVALEGRLRPGSGWDWWFQGGKLLSLSGNILVSLFVLNLLTRQSYESHQPPCPSMSAIPPPGKVSVGTGTHKPANLSGLPLTLARLEKLISCYSGWCLLLFS